VQPQQGIGATEAGSRLHHLGRLEGAPDDPGIGARLERETEAALSQHADRVPGI
jgi:hypothetical protein